MNIFYPYKKMPCRKCQRSHRRCKCYRSVEDISLDYEKFKCETPLNPKNNELPFVENNGFIQYNISRGVEYTDPTILGSSTPIDTGSSGYRSTHLTFDPSIGTLTAGTDVNNGWANLGENSLITGKGNRLEADNSFVSGTNNTILDSNKCQDAPSDAILGGVGNTIEGSCSSVIIASNNVRLTDSPGVAVIGINLSEGNTGGYKNFSNSILTTNVYSINGITTGPIFNGKRIPPTVPKGFAFQSENKRETEEVTDYQLDPSVWSGDISATTIYGAGGVYGSELWAGTSTRNGWVPGPLFAASVDAANIAAKQVNLNEILSQNLAFAVAQDENKEVGGNENTQVAGTRSVTAATNKLIVDEDIEQIQGSRIQSIGLNRVSVIGADETIEVGNNAALKTQGDRVLDVAGDVISNVAGRAAWKIKGQSELECDFKIDRVTTRSDIFSPITQFYGDLKSEGNTSTRFTFVSTYIIASEENSAPQIIVTPFNTSTYNVAPLKSDINILIDSSENEFSDGQFLTFKDITLSYVTGTSYNVYITTNNDIAIQYRDQQGQLQIAQNGTYTIRTTGGSIGLRYSKSVEGSLPTWNIIEEIVGQPRQ